MGEKNKYFHPRKLRFILKAKMKYIQFLDYFPNISTTSIPIVISVLEISDRENLWSAFKSFHTIIDIAARKCF